MIKPASTQLQVDKNHPSFAGHFPGHPLVPGVVLLDWVIQALNQHCAPLPNFVCGAWQIEQAKFLSPVAPGDTLNLDLKAKTALSVQFQVTRANTLIASGVLSWMST